jgi:hypothetical protein
VTIVDYFAIGVLTVLIPWGGRRFLMTYRLSPRQSEPTSDQESRQPQTDHGPQADPNDNDRAKVLHPRLAKAPFLPVL